MTSGEKTNGEAFCDGWAELLDEVKGERWASWTKSVEEADLRVEAQGIKSADSFDDE